MDIVFDDGKNTHDRGNLQDQRVTLPMAMDSQELVIQHKTPAVSCVDTTIGWIDEPWLLLLVAQILISQKRQEVTGNMSDSNF